ncbi:MAG TPA: POTRA domain-containing protein, partial [Labilithrix sp.]|nr:POTRA domain-containing protein [Labilithrix sp.]
MMWARRSRWFAQLVLALVFVLGVVPSAGAQPTPAPPRLRAVPDEEVSVLKPPPPSVSTVPAPDIAAPPDLTPFLGRPISAVDVVLDDDRWPDEHPPLVTEMHAGDRLTPALVRRAIAEALQSGHFADAQVELVNEGPAVRATIHVMPRKVIESVRLDTHGAPLDGDELLRDAELAVDGEIVGRDVIRHKAKIEALLQRRGFPSPTVIIGTRPTDDPLRVVLLVDVIAGAPRNIERRVIYPFRGTPEAVQDAEKHYAARTGMRADEVSLEAADTALQTRIRGRGWHRADVSHDMVLHRGLVVLRVRVDFGTHYETRYEGNEHFDKSTLDELLDLENETDRTPNHLVQKLHDYYVKHGFLDADVKLETRGDASDPIDYLVFHVTEQQRVFVAARAYPCLREADVKKLSEGGPPSASAIGSEIDSYLEEELPGNDILVPPNPRGSTIRSDRSATR